MNEFSMTGACADYEHDLVEQVEGSLGPERARVIRQHVDACPRCRAWQAEFAALNDRLADAIPRPMLSANFERGLQDRLATLVQPARRGNSRASADREHQRLIEALRRGARRHALLDAIGSAAVAFCLVVVARGFSGQTGLLLDVPVGPVRWVMLGGAGAAVALAALAWSAARGACSIPGWRH